MKNEIRVIGIDDSPFNKFRDADVLLIGVVMRGGSWIDGILSTKAAVDGDDSTAKIVEMINNCKFKPQLRCIFLNGIAVGGFNVIDVEKLNRETGLPIIVVIRKNPDLIKIKDTLRKLDKASKIALLTKAGEVHKLSNIFVQLAGIDEQSAKELMRTVCTRSRVPEALRLAHLIASGIVLGESRGNA